MKIRLLLTIVAAATVGLSAAAQSVNPMDLMGRKPKPFIEPDGFYRVVLPSGFDCDATSRKRFVKCQGNRGHRALLTIEVQDVPPSANAKLAAFNQMKAFKKKREHFKELGQEPVRLNGTEGIIHTFTYDYLGNVQIPIGVKAMYLVQSGKLIVIHFESRMQKFRQYENDLATFFSTFYPTKLDAGGNPILEDLQVEGSRKQNGRFRMPGSF